MRHILTCLTILALSASILSAQESQRISLGRSIDGTLASESRHSYTLELEANAFVHGEVNQIDVDVVVKILDPDGEELREFDSPARGPEPFQFETESEGTFVIEVTPFEGGEGDYTITVLRVEPIATDPERRVDQWLVPYSGEDSPGGVVAVVDEGEMRFVRAFGLANLEHSIPFEAGTISNIGSVTKQFTAMGLLLLQAEGKLSIEDDIREHIPELPDFGTPITIRNLLNHTGGYREIYNLLPMAGYQGEDALRREEAIRIVQSQRDLQTQPNTVMNYNNTGYILLATTIERVSGMTYPEYMKARVFEPLGMSDTRVKGYQGEIIPGSAQGYVSAEGGGFRYTKDLAASYGAGGIYTTAQDLTKWMLNYRDATLGGPEAIEAITTRAVLAGGDTTGYGLGLGVGRLRGRTYYTHTGGDNAHRAFFGYSPDLESGVIILSNNGSFDLSMGSRIAIAFFEDRLDPVEEEVEEPEAEASGSMTPERMEAIAGDWVIEASGASLGIVYSVEDGEMFAQATGQPRIRVIPKSDSTFTFEGVAASVTFHFESDGSVVRATHHQNGDAGMRRIEKAELTSEDLQAYVGRYFSEELETFYEITVEDGKLMANHRNMEPFALTHGEGDDFTGTVFFFASVAFERVGNGEITGFMASNGRTRNVWFRKL
ncbi:serine hydrolase domain-containing protein [Gemmatimonadota bacterium]